MSKKAEQTIIYVLWIITGLVCIKSIFTDFGGDDAYQMVMSYRHLNGDLMFTQMWEPHQTSIFVNDLLLLLYKLAVPSFTGAALYLQICGTALFALICVLVYKLIKPVAGRLCAHFICSFILVFRVKQTPCIEFSNLEIAFSVLAFVCLVKFINDQQKVGYLCLVGLFVFLQTLSYPTCLVSLIAVMVMLIAKTEKKVRNCITVFGICAGLGMVYAIYFVVRIGFVNILTIAANIFNSDTHSVRKFGAYWTGLVYALIGLLISTIIAFAICKFMSAIKAKKCSYLVCFGVACFFMEVLLLISSRLVGFDWNSSFYIVPLVMIFIGLSAYKKMDTDEKIIWIAGNLFAVSSFVATLMLTDLGIITIVSYLMLGGAVSFIPLRHLFIDTKKFAMFSLCILSLVLFHRGIVVWGYGNYNGNVERIYEIENVVRSGPTAGIFCNYMTKAFVDANTRDFGQYISEDDKVLLVGGELIDPNDFILAKGNISNQSVIDTPLYNESLENYFSINSKKRPSVVAVSSWFGNIAVDVDSWIIGWINENYDCCGDGDYWKFYRLKEANNLCL